MPFTLKQIEALGDLYNVPPIGVSDLKINQFYYFLTDLGDTTAHFNLRNKQYPKYYPRVVWVGKLSGIKHEPKKITLIFTEYAIYKGKKGTKPLTNQAQFNEVPLENLIGKCINRKDVAIVKVRTSLPVMLPENSKLRHPEINSALLNVTTVANPLPMGLVDPLTYQDIRDADAIAQEISDLQTYYDNQYD